MCAALSDDRHRLREVVLLMDESADTAAHMDERMTHGLCVRVFGTRIANNVYDRYRLLESSVVLLDEVSLRSLLSWYDGHTPDAPKCCTEAELLRGCATFRRLSSALSEERFREVGRCADDGEHAKTMWKRYQDCGHSVVAFWRKCSPDEKQDLARWCVAGDPALMTMLFCS